MPAPRTHLPGVKLCTEIKIAGQPLLGADRAPMGDPSMIGLEYLMRARAAPWTVVQADVSWHGRFNSLTLRIDVSVDRPSLQSITNRE